MKKNFHSNPASSGQKHKNIISLLNLNYIQLSNSTRIVGEFDLPELVCKTTIYPDYIALYTQPGDYHRTKRTAVSFYCYDQTFDGQNGLFNAIYYNNTKDLKKYKARFKNVHFVITPDYSQLGDADRIENLYRLKKARIVGLWFSEEIGSIVIPHITFSSLVSIEESIVGFEQCEVVAFSTKGYITNPVEREALKQAIRFTVDNLNLRAIIVYDVCGDNAYVNDIFQYALEQGVEIVIPRNMLKERNSIRRKEESDAQ